MKTTTSVDLVGEDGTQIDSDLIQVATASSHKTKFGVAIITLIVGDKQYKVIASSLKDAIENACNCHEKL